jgi:hypothetical protein
LFDGVSYCEITLLRMIGLILLNTRFPRPFGDGGNPASWGEPVCVHRLRAARVAQVVTHAPLSAALCDEVVSASNALAASGARCITTSCGFFASIQNKVASQISVPFVSSSLCLIPTLIAQGMQLEEIGVLTFDAAKLGPLHFEGVNAPIPAAQNGLILGNILQKCIARDETELDLAEAQQEVVAGARALKIAHPRVQKLILECTNLAPYRGAIEAATGMHTYDIRDAVERLCPMQK